MNKKLFYIFSLGFLLGAPSAFAAQTSSTNTPVPAQGNSANSLTLNIEKYNENVSEETLSSWVTNKTAFSLNTNFRREFENASFCPVNKIFCTLTITNTEQQHLHLDFEKIPNTKVIQTYLDDLARKVNRDPENAKFLVQDGKVTTFAQTQDGITLDTKESLKKIAEFLTQKNSVIGQTLQLPYESKKATSDYGDINNLGISALLGEGTSNFKGSPVNRVKNIKAAVAHFNGALIKPGEEFSFVKLLGEVDAEHGYFPELVIKKNITEPEFGGGICQVSSTVFRAAIYSGLKITARRNHAYPVSYYNPQGMDATVYVPNPDLKFINNTPGYILIQAKIEGTVLTFDFYGTDDGRKTTVDGPKITEKQPDGSIKATFTQHVIDKDGKEFISDVFNSAYASPYLFPHPGGPVLTSKPANWSDDQWKNYKQMLKDIAKASNNKS